jgi:hypothetical protein
MYAMRWIVFLAIGLSLATSARRTQAQTVSSLDRLLDSPLSYRPLDVQRWSPSDRFSYELSHRPDRHWSQRWRTDYSLRYSYPSYYRFAERVPGFYNDREHRFWSNSYGGPWYYPGSPTNTRSSWLDWKPLDW